MVLVDAAASSLLVNAPPYLACSVHAISMSLMQDLSLAAVHARR